MTVPSTSNAVAVLNVILEILDAAELIGNLGLLLRANQDGI